MASNGDHPLPHPWQLGQTGRAHLRALQVRCRTPASDIISISSPPKPQQKCAKRSVRRSSRAPKKNGTQREQSSWTWSVPRARQFCLALSPLPPLGPILKPHVPSWPAIWERAESVDHCFSLRAKAVVALVIGQRPSATGHRALGPSGKKKSGKKKNRTIGPSGRAERISLVGRLSPRKKKPEQFLEVTETSVSAPEQASTSEICRISNVDVAFCGAGSLLGSAFLVLRGFLFARFHNRRGGAILRNLLFWWSNPRSAFDWWRKVELVSPFFFELVSPFWLEKTQAMISGENRHRYVEGAVSLFSTLFRGFIPSAVKKKSCSGRNALTQHRERASDKWHT